MIPVSRVRTSPRLTIKHESVFAHVLLLISYLWACSAVPAGAATAPLAVSTQHNDNFRTGDYLSETALTPKTVTESGFGKLWQLQVIGRIYAQPLFAPNVTTTSGTHNLVLIVTALNNVYAYDADAPSTLYWKRNLGAPVPSSNYNNGGHTYYAVYPDIGILSTPVIDPTTNTMYVVADVAVKGLSQFYLHALSLSTGADEIGHGVLIAGSVRGTGNGSVGGLITFAGSEELQRPALLLSNGTLFVAFGSHNDQTPAFGWMFAYSELTLSVQAIYCSGPNGSGLGSFWNSGQGAVVGAGGYLYTSTGNGPFDADTGGTELGQSVIKLSFSGTALTAIDYFTPWDVKHEDSADEDLGSCGPLLVPGTNLLVQGGKDGHFYVLDSQDLGEYQPLNNDQIVQDFQACESEIHGSPVYWQSGANKYVYVWSQGDYLKQYEMVAGMFNTTPSAESMLEAPNGGPGATLSVSANGHKTGSGIVWAYIQDTPGGYNKLLPGVLRAYNADNVGQEVWDSQMNSGRDAVGDFAKFVPPTVAHDKVFVATNSNYVAVYGLL